jgi:hypothetical protein
LSGRERHASVRQGWKVEVFAHQPVDRSLARPGVGIGSHSVAVRRQVLVGFAV